MWLVTSKCVPKSNATVSVLPYLAFLFLSFLNYIVSLFLFLPVLIFPFEFIPPFLIFPSAFVLPVPTFFLPVLILTFPAESVALDFNLSGSCNCKSV